MGRKATIDDNTLSVTSRKFVLFYLIGFGFCLLVYFGFVGLWVLVFWVFCLFVWVFVKQKHYSVKKICSEKRNVSVQLQ